MGQCNTIVMRFDDEPATARVKLLWELAPVTCQAIARQLPLRGSAHHGIYSGSECVFLLPEVLKLEKEHATSDVSRGQVGFAWMAAGSSYGVNEDFAEICWFYDLDAKPRMWEGPVAVNVFGEIVEPADEFYAVCFRMRRAGVQAFSLAADVAQGIPT